MTRQNTGEQLREMRHCFSSGLIKQIKAMQEEKERALEALSHLAHCKQCQHGVSCVNGEKAKQTLTAYGVK